jgi:hypothetical protein
MGKKYSAKPIDCWVIQVVENFISSHLLTRVTPA